MLGLVVLVSSWVGLFAFPSGRHSGYFDGLRRPQERRG